ncbi:MAG: pGP6-D family virulence protein [Parachlamydia sp.]|jgi:hypothetical protein|nr:pGP6-D family virulence protein [Parachlamydia sp.]
MAKVNAILDQRIKKDPPLSKMAELARQSSSGNLTSFSGLFAVSELSEQEKSLLENLLKAHAQETDDITCDLQNLILLTAEVKAINNQAAILHGERIKKAHQLLIGYKEGAFTAWLIAAYGNRQTPYNLMQYYEFYEAMPKILRPQIEWMPRQAVYVLASRQGSIEKKQDIVKNYQGETKQEVLQIIREAFPLDERDKRQTNPGEALIIHLQKLAFQTQKQASHLTALQKEQLRSLLKQMQKMVI